MSKVEYWLSSKPEGKLIGVKAVINFNLRTVRIIEEDGEGEQYDKVTLDFYDVRRIYHTINKKEERG